MTSMGKCAETKKFCDGRRKYCHVTGDTYFNLWNKDCGCYTGIRDGERVEADETCFEED